MLTLFTSSLLLGIVFCAPPGAIAAEAIRRGFAKGFRPALFVEFGSLVGDATWALVALVGLAVLVQNPIVRLPLALLGAAMLIYLARGALLDAYQATLDRTRRAFIADLLWGGVAVGGMLLLIQNVALPINVWLNGGIGAVVFLIGWQLIGAAAPNQLPQARSSRATGDFATGAVMSLGNPWNIVFWVGLGSKQLATLNNPQSIDYVIFFAGFMAGAVLWCFFMAGLIAWGRQFITPTFFRRINLVCGLFLGYFAVQLVWSLVG